MRELKKEDVKKVIEGRGHGDHTPMLYDMWIYPWIYEESREAFEKFMDAQIKDVDFVDLVMPDNFHAPEGYPDFTLDWKLESLEALYDETEKYQKRWEE